uniref:Lissencephaly-1 homolog n=1 Tax=Asterionellopsis glacialis TaxID=33640 RepID=A0A7S0PTV4_9STRA|mmetsp:Transcript_1943/g.2851  ORF Transcript_1943/g.2851 Transcript_1943/m.2851 type:complete len:450 (+) Transcript_1943:59-1408(+)
MVLTDRQRSELHSGLYEYFKSRQGDEWEKVAAALAEADPDVLAKEIKTVGGTPLLEKKWTAIPRLQKKVLELERTAAQNAKIHAHRTAGGGDGSGGAGGGLRRMLPRLPCAHTLQGHSAVVEAVAVHPVFTVVVSGSEDGTIKIWDHESGDYVRTLKGHTNTVNSLSFSPTGAYLVSSSTDLSIKLWDFSTYACLRTLRGHDHTISAVSFLPVASLLEAAANNTAASGGTEPASTTTGVASEVAGCKFLLSASRDQTVKLWDVESGFCDATIQDHNDWVRCLAVTEKGDLWASSGNDQVICVYHAEGSNNEKIVELRGHEHVVESVAFLTCNPTAAATSKHDETVRDYLASGSRDRTVKLWSIASAACLATFTAHENWVRSVLIHPSGNYIISAGDDRTIRVFDIKAQRCLRTLEGCHSHFVSSLAMHHTLPILVSGSVDQMVKCWMLD